MKKIFYFAVAAALILASCSKEEDGEKPNDTVINIVNTPVTASSSKWISGIVDFRPAPGQYGNKTYSLPAAAESIVGGKGMVSLGAFGGYVIFKFDHSVINQDGYDFVIHGNAGATSNEPGIVMVSVDVNGNGLPDDPWYELAGEEYANETTLKNYTLTYYKPSQTDTSEDVRWTDNFGEEGYVYTNNFHRQCYYPLFLEGDPETLTFTGTLLPETKTLNGSVVVLPPVGKGYVDNYSEDYPEVIGDDDDTRNSNKFDISNAVDSKGRKMKITAIDFVKVYTAQMQDGGMIGETSTEVCGAISLSVN